MGYLSFKNQDIISRYRISKSAPWEYTTERSFQFTSLAPASYTFELEYSTDNVHWNPSGIGFNFMVTPPWWQLWYFQTGIILISIFFILLYARFQIKNYQQKNRLLNLVNTQQQKLVHAEINITERERKRIAKELHDGVGTSITAIKLGVMSQLVSHLNGNVKIQEIEDQFQTTLKEIKDIAYALTPPDLERYGLCTALTGYVNKLSASIGKEIQLNMFGRDLPEGEAALSIFRILQELISNSLKHAKAKHINITINSFNDLLSIIFEDDGVGFEPDKVERGLGLANIESRVQLLNGTILLESTRYGVSYLIDIPMKEARP
jgi:signal transduction histidine kinase